MDKNKVNVAELSWNTNEHGVKFKTLFKRFGRVLSLIELPPNCTLDPHLHPKNEYVYVLQGAIHDGDGSYTEGTFFINPKDSVHAPFTQANGCLLLVLWCGRVDPLKNECGERS